MKILLANKFFFLNGGSERVYFQEREFLKGSGLCVMDFSMRDPRNFASAFSGFFVDSVDFRAGAGFVGRLNKAVSFIRSSQAVERLTALIDRERPDIAHLHNIYHQLTPSIISVLKKKGIKVVLTLHDGKLVCPSYLMLNDSRICTRCAGEHFYRAVSARCQASLSGSILLSLEAYWHKWMRSYDEVDLFLSPSRFLADLTAIRIPAHKITVLRNGIDTEEYEPVLDGGRYALYFGRLSREKGIETLLQAHTHLSDEIPLKIVGTGPLERDLRDRFPNAEFLGYRTGDELIRLIQEAAFVVVPSEWYENCSMVVLEAMALGKPVIASRIGGIPEQVEDGKTGLLFDMGNGSELAHKMMVAWESPELRKRMGMAAREKLEEEYSLERHCTDLLHIYKDLLS